jgi:hypothetical protein
LPDAFDDGSVVGILEFGRVRQIGKAHFVV